MPPASEMQWVRDLQQGLQPVRAGLVLRDIPHDSDDLHELWSACVVDVLMHTLSDWDDATWWLVLDLLPRWCLSYTKAAGAHKTCAAGQVRQQMVLFRKGEWKRLHLRYQTREQARGGDGGGRSEGSEERAARWYVERGRFREAMSALSAGDGGVAEVTQEQLGQLEELLSTPGGTLTAPCLATLPPRPLGSGTGGRWRLQCRRCSLSWTRA